MQFNAPCVILAGGKSSRMGQDKSLLPFGECPTLTHYQAARLKPLFESLHVSTKEDKFDGEFALILDKNDGVFSPMVALASILENFKDSYVFCLSVDAPFVEEEQIKALWEVAQKTPNSAIIPRDLQTRHPLCGFYHSSLASMARQLANEENHKLGFLLQKCGATYVDFKDSKPFTNLNHPHEYEESLKNQSLV